MTLWPKEVSLLQIKMATKSKEDKAADRDRSNLLAMLNATYD